MARHQVICAPFSTIEDLRRGGRARSNAPVLKTGEGLSLPWVRIPPSPPNLIKPRMTGLFYTQHVANFPKILTTRMGHFSVYNAGLSAVILSS